MQSPRSSGHGFVAAKRPRVMRTSVGGLRARSTDVARAAQDARRFARTRVGTWNDGARDVHVSQPWRRAGNRRARALQRPRRPGLSRRQRAARRQRRSTTSSATRRCSRAPARTSATCDRAKSAASRSPTASPERSKTGRRSSCRPRVASFELPPVGSNVVRLDRAQQAAARKRADAHRDRSARTTPFPAREAQVTIRIHNAGESSAHDVVVVAPIPEHTSYVAGSARVNGRDDRTRAGHVLRPRCTHRSSFRSLPASASATISYRVRIDAPLRDGTQIVARARMSRRKRRPRSRSSPPR